MKKIPQTIASMLAVPAITRQAVLLTLFLMVGAVWTLSAEEAFVIPEGKKSGNVYYGKKGDLIYRVQSNGDRIIDFAGAGYKGLGNTAVPTAADLAHLPAIKGLKRGSGLQGPIDTVASWPMRADGFRGVIYLAGKHPASCTLNASGIVLIGRKMNPNATGETLLTFKGNDKTAISIGGSEGGRIRRGPVIGISSYRVPTGSRSFLVGDPSAFSVGDRVEIKLTPNTRWVNDIGMDKEFWNPAHLKKTMSRVITSINGNEINIDEPTVITIWNRHGGATINTVKGGGPIRNVGIMGVSIKGNPVSSASTLPGVAIRTGYAKDVFLQSISTTGFKRSALFVGKTENLTASAVRYQGAGETGGSHRYGFQLGGQKNFLHNVYTYAARHAFVPNPGTTGGNVFLGATSAQSIFESGGHRHWSGATLWDRCHIKHDTLTARRVRLPNINHGWRAVNNVAWNSRGRSGYKDVIFQNPKHAYNIREFQIEQIPSLYWAQRVDRSDGVQFREYVIGDYDAGAGVNPVDSHTPDPEWAAEFAQPVPLDTPLRSRTVAMTFDLNLQPGERVVGGQLSIGRGGTNGKATISLNGKYPWVPWGQVATLDLANGNRLGAIRNGKLNVAVTSDHAEYKVDFAMLKLKITEDFPPSITGAFPSRAMGEAEAMAPLAFSVSDGETAAADLVVTATSSHEDVVANDGLVIVGSGATRELRVNPRAGAAGATTIALRVTDAAGLHWERAFVVYVGRPSVQLKRVGDGVEMRMRAHPQVLYQCEESPDMKVWSAIGAPVQTDSAELVMPVPDVGMARYFYRVKVILP